MTTQLAGMCLTVASCGLVLPALQSDVSEGLKSEIANNLAQEIASLLPSDVKSIVVRSTGNQAWLPGVLAGELQSRAYRVEEGGDEDTEVVLKTSSLGPAILQVTVDLEPDVRIDRLYRLERSKKRSSTFNFAATTFKSRSPRVTDSKSGASQLDAPASNILIDLPTIQMVEIPAKTSALKQSVCEVYEFQPGSLKKNLTRMLENCGWRLAAWPLDPSKAGYELDWVIAGRHAIEAVSLQELALALERAFSLKVDLDMQGKTARFELNP